MILLPILLLLSIAEQALGCSQFSKIQTSLSKQETSKLTLDPTKQIAIAFWFRYVPLKTIAWAELSVTDDESLFFALFDAKNNKYPLIVNFSASKIFLLFKVVFRFHFTNNMYRAIDVLVDPLKIDGTWMYIYIQNDIDASHTVTNYVYNTLEPNRASSVKTYGFQFPDSELTLISRGTLYTVIPSTANPLQTSTFLGETSIIEFKNEPGIVHADQNAFISYASTRSCTFPVLCAAPVTEIIIKNWITLDGTSTVYSERFYLLKRYLMSGWAKLKPYNQLATMQTVLIRASMNKLYGDDIGIGDRSVFLRYQLSNQPALNGIYFATYSYLQPDAAYYDTTPDDTYEDYGTFYPEALTKWHYFQFQHGINDVEFGTEIFFYFNHLNTYKTHKFYNRNHFFDAILHVNIGGDIYSSESWLVGQVADFQIRYCHTADLPKKVTCHYSCETCDGPTDKDCLTCVTSSTSHRLYVANTKACLCEENYIDFKDQPNCQLFTTVYDKISISEVPVSSAICKYGEFLLEDGSCVKCPQNISAKEINCADCLQKPKVWAQNPVCTADLRVFDPLVSSVFQRIERKPTDYEFYLIDDKLKQTTLCQGCKGLKEFFYQPFIVVSHFSKSIEVICKPCYAIVDGQCKQIDGNCQACNADTNQCTQCAKGYVLDPTSFQCKKCPISCSAQCGINSSVAVCTSCPSGYSLNNGQCVQCGQYCSICALKSGILRCYKCIDTSAYVLSFDGQTCFKNIISNCEVALQVRPGYFQQEASIDITFTPSSDQSVATTLCAVCKSGYRTLISVGQCEVEANPIAGQVNVKAIDGTNVELVSKTELSKVKQGSQCFVNNCQHCMLNYYSGQEFCLLCNQGFYANLFTGFCSSCPTALNCDICFHQHMTYKDGWKRQVAAYYYLFVNDPSDQDHPYNLNVLTSIVEEYEVACQTCKLGYEMYQGACIKKCPENCLECSLIDGQNVCIKCTSTVQGQIQATENNQCMSCPSNCALCRTLPKAEYVNQYFSPSFSSLSQYSNQCLFSTNVNRAFDWTISQYINCSGASLCQKELKIPVNVYCRDIDYTTAYNAATQKDLFQKANMKLTELFSTLDGSHFSAIESEVFYIQINNNVIRKTIYELTLVYPTDITQDCQIPASTFIKTSMFQNVYSLTEVEVRILGNIDKPLTINGDLSINGFNQVVLQNIYLLNKQSYTITINPVDWVEITFSNIKISQQGTTFLKNQFLFYNPKILKLTNIQILNIRITDSKGLFQQLMTNDKLTPLSTEFKSIIISESSLRNSGFINLQTHLQDQIFTFENFQASKLTFDNSYLIQNIPKALKYKAQLTLKDVIVQESTFVKGTLFLIDDMVSQAVSNVKILKNRITQAKVFNLNIFTLDQLLFQENVLDASFCITNVFQNMDRNENLVYKISNAIFEKNEYTFHRVFLEIKQQLIRSLSTELTSIKLNTNFLSTSTLDVDTILYDYANIFLQCTTIKLQDFEVIRAVGYPELSFSNSTEISVKNLQAYLNPTYYKRVLNEQLDCIVNDVKRFNTLLLLTSNLKVTIIDSSFRDLIIANSALIVYISQDRVNYNNQEQIAISNSQFRDIVLITTKTASSQAIFMVTSEQTQVISIMDCQFEFNHQHSYVQDVAYRQSSTVLINSPLSTVNMERINLLNNVITNSQYSNLVIQAGKIVMTKCRFENSNQLLLEKFSKYIIWGVDEGVIYFEENLLSAFPISTYGGSALFISNDISISGTQVINSQSLLGGAFYFQNKANGLLNIVDTVFIKCGTNLNQGTSSQGGTLYIDASQSQLNLKILNTIILDSKSRNDGGSIYINPSIEKSSITMSNLNVTDSYSLQGGFLKIQQVQQQQVVMNIEIKQVNFKNSRIGLNRFLEELEQLTVFEIQAQSSNYIFHISNGVINIDQLQIQNVQYFGLLSLTNLDSISINHLVAANITLATQSSLNIVPASATQIVIQNSIFQNINSTIQFSTSTCTIPTVSKIILQCKASFSLPGLLYKFKSDVVKEATRECNLFSIGNAVTSNQPVINIASVGAGNFIEISQTTIRNVNCPNCQLGVMAILNVATGSKKKLVSMKQLNLEQNVCGKTTCLLIASQSLLQLSSRLLAGQDEFRQIRTISITLSEFVQNQATFGGALLIWLVDTIITNSRFTQNSATEIGGALYFHGSSDIALDLYSSEIKSNTARIGGGVYLINQVINKESGNLIYENLASFFGNNLAEFPDSLTASINEVDFLPTQRIRNQKDWATDLVAIRPYKLGDKELSFLTFPSGQSLNQYHFFSTTYMNFVAANIKLRIMPLNQRREQIRNLDNSNCSIDGAFVRKGDHTREQSKYYENFTDTKIVTFNSTSQDYNLDTIKIYFDPDFNKEFLLQIRIRCSSIKIPLFSSQPPFLLDSYNQNYSLLLNLQTFPCQQGEYKKSDDGTCLLCDSATDQFTVRAGEKCMFRDQVSMKSVSPARVELRPGYWRPFEGNILVESCKNLPSNCNGGWEPGDKSCYVGHIGALCEQCDLYNIRGEGAYSISTIYKCGSCELVGDNTQKVVLISIWTLISILLSVQGNHDAIMQKALGKILKEAGFISFNPRNYIGAILIKVLTNYFQIVGTITTFQLSLPSAFNDLFSSVGSPIEAMSYSLDCFLVHLALDADIEMLYFRVLWGILMPMMYIGIFFLLFGIAILIGKVQKGTSFATTTFIYMYIYLQPTLIGSLVALVSFRQISGYFWIQGNVAYRYDSNQHAKWLLGFVLPLLLSIAIFIPIYMLMNLRKRRGSLGRLAVLKDWGYLYIEYTEEAYMWEIVKIVQKGLIIIFLTFYEDLIIIKASLIFLIVFVYSLLSRKYNPYESRFLNYQDYESTLICGLSIVLALTIYSASKSGNEEVIWPFYILLIGFNAYFCIKLLFYIILGQLSTQQDKLDKIRDKIREKFPDLQNKNQFFRRLLTNRAEQEKLIKSRFQMIKKYLFKIVKPVMQHKRRTELYPKTVMKKKTSLYDSEAEKSLKSSAKVHPYQNLSTRYPKSKLKGPDKEYEKVMKEDQDQAWEKKHEDELEPFQQREQQPDNDGYDDFGFEHDVERVPVYENGKENEKEPTRSQLQDQDSRKGREDGKENEFDEEIQEIKKLDDQEQKQEQGLFEVQDREEDQDQPQDQDANEEEIIVLKKQEEEPEHEELGFVDNQPEPHKDLSENGAENENEQTQSLHQNQTQQNDREEGMEDQQEIEKRQEQEQKLKQDQIEEQDLVQEQPQNQDVNEEEIIVLKKQEEEPEHEEQGQVENQPEQDQNQNDIENLEL